MASKITLAASKGNSGLTIFFKGVSSLKKYLHSPPPGRRSTPKGGGGRRNRFL